MDFGYTPGKTVLHDISVYAEPGQKVAFVGATGAGKTTITNLINRFYDIADGKIRYDGININKIKKSDLRRARHRAAGCEPVHRHRHGEHPLRKSRTPRMRNASPRPSLPARIFIRACPRATTPCSPANGSDLSQGQRQLLCIARAAVADPPVMIFDEATSSIDTRTEALVQSGMDELMERAHHLRHRAPPLDRRNSDAIIVLDHGRIIERGSHDELIAETRRILPALYRRI